MKQKHYLLSVIVLTAVGLSAVGAVNYYVDPFYYYRGVKEGEQVVSFGEMYQNFGMAENFEYDALITGTSMTESFTASQFSENFDCDAIKLPFAGGHTKDFTMLFEHAFSTHDIAYVFYGLDTYTLLTETDTTRFEFDKYQTSDNPIYDVQYLLNWDILFNYSYQKYSLTHSASYTFNVDDMYKWGADSVYGKDIVLSGRTLEPFAEDYGVSEAVQALVVSNIASIEQYITDNPDTQFYIFFPPYSIVYWQEQMEEGGVSTQMYTLQTACETLLAHDNVRLYSFMMDYALITNLDNYKDHTHYSEAINTWMCDAMLNDDYLITMANYEQILSDFEMFIRSYDYSILYE